MLLLEYIFVWPGLVSPQSECLSIYLLYFSKYQNYTDSHHLITQAANIIECIKDQLFDKLNQHKDIY